MSDNVEPLPPQDLVAEQSVLGSMLLSATAIAAVAELLRPSDFYRPAHQTLFQAILRLVNHGYPADPVTVKAELQRSGELSQAGGAPYLHTLIQGVPTATNVAYYAEIVGDKAMRRRLVEAGTRIAQLGYAGGDDETLTIVERARSVLDEVPSGPRVGTGRQLVETIAADVTMRRQSWLWTGRIVTGGLTLLAGREGLGKSTVAVDLAARVTRGELDGECHGEPRTVIYVHSEDAREYTIVPRLAAAGADLSRVVFLDALTATGHEAPLVLPTDTHSLAATIRSHRAALIVLDAATSVIDSALDGDRDRQMRQGLEPISRLAADTGIGILGIVHFGKRESGDTGKLILGSIAWSQVARSVLAVARDEEEGHLVVTATKSNLAPGDAPSLAVRLVSTTIDTPDGPDEKPRVEWIGETSQRAQELLSAPQDGDERSLTAEAVAWLRGYLAEPERGGSASAGDILRDGRRDGFNDRLLQRARKRAEVATHRSATGWTWTLADGPAVDDARHRGDTSSQGDKGAAP